MGTVPCSDRPKSKQMHASRDYDFQTCLRQNDLVQKSTRRWYDANCRPEQDTIRSNIKLLEWMTTTGTSQIQVLNEATRATRSSRPQSSEIRNLSDTDSQDDQDMCGRIISLWGIHQYWIQWLFEKAALEAIAFHYRTDAPGPAAPDYTTAKEKQRKCRNPKTICNFVQ